MDFITLTQQQAALERALEESPDTGVLFLVPNLLGPGRLQDWLQTLPDSVFQIGSTVITSVSDTEFTVVGEALDTLPLPQYPTMSSSVASGTVTLTFSQATLGSDIAQAMDWDEVVWQLNQESYQGQASLTQPGLLHFDGLPHSPEGRSYGDWLSDFSGGAGNSHMTNGVPFLDSLTAQSIRCVWSFDTIAPTLPSLELQLSDPDDSLTLGPFSFTQAIIGTQIMLRTQEDGSVQCQDSNFVQMQVLMSDLEVEANLTISPAFNWQLTLTSRAGLTWSGVTEYLASTDYGAPLASIASALDNLPLSELTLNRVHLVVNPRALSVLSVTLLGTFQLFTGTIEYTLDLPSGNFYGALFGEKKIGQTVLYGGIPVQPILAEYFGQDNLFPATTVSTLTWSILPGTQTFTLNLGLDEVLRFHIGFTPVSIKRLDLNIRKSIAEDTLSGSFTGMFTLAEVIFYTEAVFRDDGDWDFIGKVDHGLISLVDFVQGVASFTGATLPSNVPETTIFDLEIGFSTAHQNFALKAKTDSTVVIPFLDIEESRIYVDIDMATGIDGETGLRVLRGKMIGQFEIAETATFLLSYEIAQKNHIFEASWQVPEGSEDYLSMHSFLRAMGIEELPVNVDGNDLELSSAYLRYEVATQTLTLVGETTAYGKAFLVATQKPPEGEITRKRWSYVVGWNYENVSSFSDIDGLPESWESADVFTLESAGAWFASEDMPGFQVPVVPPILTVSPPDPRPPVERLADLDEFDGSDTTPDPFNGNSPADLEGTVEPIGVNETIDLIQGFNVVANINLGDNPESKGEIDILNTLLPTGKLTVFAAVNLGQDTSFTLAALIPGSLTIPTGEESAMVISNAQLVFSYKAGALAFVLSGQIAMTLDNVTIVATARMLISLDLVLVSLFVEFGEDGWQQPMGIPSLILKKVGFQLGIAFAPVPRVRIGLEGTFEILDEPLPDTRTPMVVESREFTRDEVQLPPGNLVSFAFVLEIVQQFPVPMLLRFYVEEIPVGSVMQSFVRASSSTLPETIQNTNLRKVSFFMAQRRLQLPSGEWASPGFRFSGLINVLDFSAYAAMAVNPVQGITGELMLSPITIGNVLTLAGTSPGLFWEEENGAPKQATVLPGPADLSGNENMVEIIEPGGAFFKFSSVHDPYLELSAQVTFLDLVGYQVEALVSEEEILFSLSYDVDGIVRAVIDINLTRTGFRGYSHFYLRLEFEVGPIYILGVNLGTLKVDSRFDLEMDIEASAEAFSLRLWGSFDFEGHTLEVPELRLDFSPQSLLNLPGLLIEWIKEKAYDVFADLFDMAHQAISTGLEGAEQILANAATTAISIASDAEAAAEQVISEAVETIAASVSEVETQIAELQAEAQQVLDDAQAEVNRILAESKEAVDAIQAEIEAVVAVANREIERIQQQILDEAEEVANTISDLAENAQNEAIAKASAVQQRTDELLADARRSSQKLINDAQKVVDGLLDEAEELWSTARRLAAEIEAKLLALAKKAESTAKKAWKTVSKY